MLQITNGETKIVNETDQNRIKEKINLPFLTGIQSKIHSNLEMRVKNVFFDARKKRNERCIATIYPVKTIEQSQLNSHDVLIPLRLISMSCC